MIKHGWSSKNMVDQTRDNHFDKTFNYCNDNFLANHGSDFLPTFAINYGTISAQFVDFYLEI